MVEVEACAPPTSNGGGRGGRLCPASTAPMRKPTIELKKRMPLYRHYKRSYLHSCWLIPHPHHRHIGNAFHLNLYLSMYVRVLLGKGGLLNVPTAQRNHDVVEQSIGRPFGASAN